MVDLEKIFKKFSGRSHIFKNRDFLRTSYLPDKILHRDKEIEYLASILAPSLKENKPSNVFVYGKTGTGKTLCVKHVIQEIERYSIKNNVNVKPIYINCKLKKVSDTPYRLLAYLINVFGQEVPATGLPTEELYKLLIKKMESYKGVIIIVLDEIDQLVTKSGDEILYNLTRIDTELKNTKISIIGISNDLLFAENLDPRVKSSLSEEEVLFSPYNALQIRDILRERARISFRENVIEEGVIEKISAISARNHGDARRALELLRITGEIAERRDLKKVTLDLVDEAENKMESETIIETIKTLPKQYQLILYAAIKANKEKKEVFTGDLYDSYRDLCRSSGIRPLTQRRVGDVVSELDMHGILNAKIVNKGRYGRTKNISVSIPERLLKKVILLLEKNIGV